MQAHEPISITFWNEESFSTVLEARKINIPKKKKMKTENQDSEREKSASNQIKKEN